MSIGQATIAKIKEMLGYPPSTHIDPLMGLDVIATKVVKMHAELQVTRMALSMAVMHGYGVPQVQNEKGEWEPLMVDAASLLGAVAFDFGQCGFPLEATQLVQWSQTPSDKDKRIVEAPKGLVSLH